MCLLQNNWNRNKSLIDAISATFPNPQQASCSKSSDALLLHSIYKKPTIIILKMEAPPSLHRFFDTQIAFDTVCRQVLVYNLYKCGEFGRLRTRKIVIHISILRVTVYQRTSFKNNKINSFTLVNTALLGRNQMYLSDDIAISALS